MILRFLSLLILGSFTAHAADVAISGLPLKTSPSTNTFIEIADMNGGAVKSGKYLLTNLASVSGVYALTNGIIATATNSAKSYADAQLAGKQPTSAITNYFLAPGANITVATNVTGTNVTWTVTGSAGGGGGTVGTMVESGASVVGALPAATDLTGTNYAPSVLIVTNQTVLFLGTNGQSAASIMLPLVESARSGVLSTFPGDNGGGTSTTNNILLFGLNYDQKSGNVKSTNQSQIGTIIESDYLGRSEWHVDMSHPQDATNVTAHSNIRPIHIEKWTNLVNPDIFIRGGITLGNQSGSNWVQLTSGGQLNFDPNMTISTFTASGLTLTPSGSGLTVGTNTSIQFRNTADSANLRFASKTTAADTFDISLDGADLMTYAPIRIGGFGELTRTDIYGALTVNKKFTGTTDGQNTAASIWLDYLPGAAMTGTAEALLVTSQSGNTRRPSDLIGVDAALTVNGSTTGMAAADNFFTTGALTTAATVTSWTDYHARNTFVSGGTITTQYGFYADALTSGAANYAFYAAGTTPSYLGGNLSVAQTNFTGELIVTNGITLGGVRQTAWPAGGSGNMVNTGASAVNDVPVYTDGSGTALTPTNTLFLTGLSVTNRVPFYSGVFVPNATNIVSRNGVNSVDVPLIGIDTNDVVQVSDATHDTTLNGQYVHVPGRLLAGSGVFTNTLNVSNLTVTASGDFNEMNAGTLFLSNMVANVVPVFDGNTNLVPSTTTTNDLLSLHNMFTTTGATVAGPILTTTPTTNGPSTLELATAGWVRSLLNNGTFLYNSTNVVGTAFDASTYLYVANQPTNGSRSYTPAAGDYIGSVMTTQRFEQVSGPVHIASWFTSSGGASSAQYTLHPEIYYTYDTNSATLLGDYTSAPQAITHGAITNEYDFVVSFPTIVNTNTPGNGFYLVRRFKIDTKTGTDTLKLSLGTNGVNNTPAHIDFTQPAVAGANWVASGTTNSTLAGDAQPYSVTMGGTNVIGAIAGKQALITTSTDLTPHSVTIGTTNVIGELASKGSGSGGSTNITDSGYVATIRNATISTNLTVNGQSGFAGFTVSTLPAGVAAGYQTYASDALTPFGSGSRVEYDGTAWWTVKDHILATTDTNQYVLSCATNAVFATTPLSSIAIQTESSAGSVSDVFPLVPAQATGGSATFNINNAVAFASQWYISAAASSDSGRLIGWKLETEVAGSVYACGSQAAVSAACDGTDTFWSTVGFDSINTATYPVSGAFFLYDRWNVNAHAQAYTNNWICVTAKASSYAFADSGVAVRVSSTAADRLAVILTTTHAYFYVNGALVQDMSNALDLPAVALLPMIRMNKTAGSTARQYYFYSPWYHVRRAANRTY